MRISDWSSDVCSSDLFHSSRIIDLSYVAAAKLGLIGPGSGQVVVEAITNQDIRNNMVAPPKSTSIPPAPPPRAQQDQPLLMTHTGSTTLIARAALHPAQGKDNPQPTTTPPPNKDKVRPLAQHACPTY